MALSFFGWVVYNLIIGQYDTGNTVYVSHRYFSTAVPVCAIKNQLNQFKIVGIRTNAFWMNTVAKMENV